MQLMKRTGGPATLVVLLVRAMDCLESVSDEPPEMGKLTV